MTGKDQDFSSFHDVNSCFYLFESVNTTSMENVSTGVLDRNKEHYLRCEDKAKKSYDALRHIQLHMSKYQ